MLLLLVFWNSLVWGLKNLYFVKLFLPYSNRGTLKSQILSKLKTFWHTLKRGWNLGWLYFLCILKKVQIHHPIQYLFYYRWHPLSLPLVNIQRTTRINFVNFWTNHLCFCFIKCCLKYIFGCSFPNICPTVIRTTRGNSFLCSVQRKFPLMPTRLQTLWNYLGLRKMMFSKLAASYISPVSVSLVLLLLYVSCFGYFFASLLCGCNFHSSSFEDTRSISKKTER